MGEMPWLKSPDTANSPPESVPNPHSVQHPDSKPSKVPDSMMPEHTNPAPFMKSMKQGMQGDNPAQKLK